MFYNQEETGPECRQVLPVVLRAAGISTDIGLLKVRLGGLVGLWRSAQAFAPRWLFLKVIGKEIRALNRECLVEKEVFDTCGM